MMHDVVMKLFHTVCIAKKMMTDIRGAHQEDDVVLRRVLAGEEMLELPMKGCRMPIICSHAWRMLFINNG
jgi:hypothetical protein